MEMEAQKRRRSSFKAARHVTVDDIAALQYVVKLRGCIMVLGKRFPVIVEVI
jgi:hypothetical protein